MREDHDLTTDKPKHGHVQKVYHRQIQHGREFICKHLKVIFCGHYDTYFHTDLNNPSCEECHTRWEPNHE